jgi:hypothetical protein
MLIDCDGCSARGAACGGCVVTLLLDTPPAIHQLSEAEAGAIEVLALAGFEVTVLEPTQEERPRRSARRSRRWHAA